MHVQHYFNVAVYTKTICVLKHDVLDFHKCGRDNAMTYTVKFSPVPSGIGLKSSVALAGKGVYTVCSLYQLYRSSQKGSQK